MKAKSGKGYKFGDFNEIWWTLVHSQIFVELHCFGWCVFLSAIFHTSLSRSMPIFLTINPVSALFLVQSNKKTSHHGKNNCTWLQFDRFIMVYHHDWGELCEFEKAT